MGSFYAPPGSVISSCFLLPVSCQDVGGCIFAALQQGESAPDLQTAFIMGHIVH